MTTLFDSVFSDLLQDLPRSNPGSAANEAPWGDLNSSTVYTADIVFPPQNRPVLTPKLPTRAKNTTESPNRKPWDNAKSTSGSPEIDNREERLQYELEKLQAAKTQVAKLKIHVENRNRQYGRALAELKSKEQKAIKEIADWKSKELAKIQKEAKQRQDNQRRIAELPCKKDRARIVELQEQIRKTENEMEEKAKRHKLIENNLQKKVNELTFRQKHLNHDLKISQTEEGALSKARVSKSQSRQSRSTSQLSSPTNNPFPLADSIIVDNIEPARKPAPAKVNKPAPILYDEDLEGMDADNEVPQIRTAPQITPLRQHPKPAMFEESPLNEDIDDSDELIEQIELEDGRKQFTYKSGLVRAIFPNGNIKQQTPNGTTKVNFVNGDTLVTETDGTQIYTYAATGTIQKNLPNGMKILTFDNGQIEKHLPDGNKEVTFPDGLVKTVAPEGEEILNYSQLEKLKIIFIP